QLRIQVRHRRHHLEVRSRQSSSSGQIQQQRHRRREWPMTVSFCRGPIGRREFLRAGTLALGGLSLPQLAAAAGQKRLESDTSVILFWMWGGPSQLETFDPKPK